MTRFTTVMSIGLALAIALVAGMVGWRVLAFSPPVQNPGSADPAVGMAFYAAINDVLMGTNSKALNDVVTSDFVNHTNDATAGELTEQLTAFGASFPGTQMQVMGMEPSANSLVVSLAPITLAPVKVAELTLSAQPFAGGYDVLRIRNGKVAERWSQEIPAISATTFPEASFATHSSASMAIRLDRTELPDGTELNWNPGRTAVLMVEKGSVNVRLDWKREQEFQHQVVTVHAGDALPIPANMKVRVAPGASASATVLIFAMWKVTPTDVPSPSHSNGATSRLLWVSNLPISAGGGWTFEFGRLQLPKRVDVTLDGGKAMEVLMCTEATSVQVVTGDGSVESLHPDLTRLDRANAAVLAPESAAHVIGADSIGLQATGDAGETVWLIAIAPISESATPTA